VSAQASKLPATYSASNVVCRCFMHPACHSHSQGVLLNGYPTCSWQHPYKHPPPRGDGQHWQSIIRVCTHNVQQLLRCKHVHIEHGMLAIAVNVCQKQLLQPPCTRPLPNCGWSDHTSSPVRVHSCHHSLKTTRCHTNTRMCQYAAGSLR
jgi:hypothetical protein